MTNSNIFDANLMRVYDNQQGIDAKSEEFNLTLENGELGLPSILYNTLKPLNADNFFETVYHFPGTIMAIIGWTREQYNQAREKLEMQLDSSFPSEYFSDLEEYCNNPPQYSFGVLPEN